MEFPDLHEFPRGHPPSPYGWPVLVVKVGAGVLPEGLTLRAVGWLERPGFPTGPTPRDCVEALLAATPGAILSDGSRGVHSCGLCGSSLPEVRWKRRKVGLKGHGHYLVESGQIVYMAPALLLHYILDHAYLPPAEFVRAVSRGRFLTEDDLVVRWRAPGEGA